MQSLATARGLRITTLPVGTPTGEAPPTLFDYLPPDALLVIDESHVTVPPQIKGRIAAIDQRDIGGDGFRLPSALDNRPLKFDEWESLAPDDLCFSDLVSMRTHQAQVAEQVVRPTGLVDPTLEVRPAGSQVDDCLSEIHAVVEKMREVDYGSHKTDGGGFDRLSDDHGIRFDTSTLILTPLSESRLFVIYERVSLMYWWVLICCERLVCLRSHWSR